MTNHLFDLESRLIFDCTQRLFRWQIFMRFCSERPVADMHRDNFIFRHRPAHDYVKIMRLYFTSGYKAGASGSLPRTCLCVLNRPSFAMSFDSRLTSSCFSTSRLPCASGPRLMRMHRSHDQVCREFWFASCDALFYRTQRYGSSTTS